MTKEFKVYYGGEPATQEHLDAIEEIVVVQEVDHAWEAQIKIPICIREDGSWDGENDEAYEQNGRVRIEVRVGDGPDWIPLIDGSIARQAPDYNASPGLSVITLVVHDDISLMDDEPPPDNFQNLSDADIINALFDIDTIPEPPEIDELSSNPDQDAVNNLHGTRIGMLREMAGRFPGFHVYVLPGDDPGTNLGCFKTYSEPPAEDLPVMYLTGPDRNLSSFNIQLNTGRAARYEGASLNMNDMSVSEGSAGLDDTPLTTGESSTSVDTVARTRRLDPGDANSTDVQAAAEAASAESGYTLSAEGQVLPQCYTGVLRPYMMVSVRVSNSRYSTDYVIERVTHTLGRSEYTQSFSVVGNAVSPETSTNAAAPAASAAAAVGAAAVSFNIQADIV